jgi:hypothetical protein
MTEQIEKIIVDWVKLYPQRLLLDLMRMPHDAGDAYSRLYLILLVEGGLMSYNLDSIAMAVQWQCLDFTQKIWPQIKHKFVVVNGYLTHPDVTESLQEAQKRLQDKRRAGLMGAKQRYGSAIAEPKHRHSTASVLPLAETQQCYVVKSKEVTVTKSNSKGGLLFTVAVEQSDRAKKRFEELFPVATGREKNTIGKLIRNCTNLVCNNKNPNALKTFVSIMRRCHEQKKPLKWLVGAANKEGIGFTNGK